MTTLVHWAGVAALGAVGALARYGLDLVVTRRAGPGFPWGTLAVNALGSFLAGLVAGWAPSETWRVLLAVGALASFTTFSTWTLETRELAVHGRRGAAAANVALSLALGLGFCGIGWAFAAAL